MAKESHILWIIKMNNVHIEERYRLWVSFLSWPNTYVGITPLLKHPYRYTTQFKKIEMAQQSHIFNHIDNLKIHCGIDEPVEP